MKITKEQLKKIIKEEISEARGMPMGTIQMTADPSGVMVIDGEGTVILDVFIRIGKEDVAYTVEAQLTPRARQDLEDEGLLGESYHVK